jgi:hypothetical protein
MLKVYFDYGGCSMHYLLGGSDSSSPLKREASSEQAP